ncbi:MAG: carboxypeptidase regulatory-like domain-containing protein [Planctomycetes bacterium]|nr:carboxypeptidase regulatory-like domain-containing protein [Planctomycetota bacterium]
MVEDESRPHDDRDDRAPASGAVIGRILGQDGYPPLEGQVARLQGGFLSMHRGQRHRVAADGRFAIGGLHAGVHPFLLEAAGHAPRQVEAAVVEGQTMDLGDVRLEAAARLRGRVLMDTGAPLPGAKVTVATGLLGLGLAETVTDPMGRFLLGELPSGPVFLGVEVPEEGPGRSEVRTVELVAGEEREVVIGGAPQVRVRFEDAALGSWNESLIGLLAMDTLRDPLESKISSDPGLRLVVADEEGGVGLSGLDPGRYLVGIPDAHGVVAISADGSADPERLILLREHLLGRVVKPGGIPDAGVRLRLHAVPADTLAGAGAGGPEGLLRIILALWVDQGAAEDGEFSLPVPGPGRYRVFASGEGLGASRPAYGVAGPRAAPALVEVEAAGRLRLRVADAGKDELLLAMAEDAAGSPVALALDDEPELWLPRGRYRLTVLRAGGRSLTTEHHAVGAGSETLVLGE